MVTDLKKRRAQELMAANYIVPDLCKNIVASVPMLAVDFIFFKDEKFSRQPHQSTLRVCSRDYHDVA